MVLINERLDKVTYYKRRVTPVFENSNKEISCLENQIAEVKELQLKATEIYKQIQIQLNAPDARKKILSESQWENLSKEINCAYEGFTRHLFSLHKLNEFEYHVSLLLKIDISPIHIAELTAHSPQAVSSVRSRLYKKFFGKNGVPKDWDDYIKSI